MEPSVSIHAPAGGATSVSGARLQSRQFQFTLPRGERRGCRGRRTKGVSFNSRSRGGSDLVPRLGQLGVDVSIHAPAGGATPNRGRPTRTPRFQFTLPRGERQARSRLAGVDVQFQFTLPRGERRYLSVSSSIIVRFNSRSRGGSDQRPSHTCTRPRVSIHAPAGGATGDARPPLRHRRFQFTLPRGERPARATYDAVDGEFQFTLPRGERRRQSCSRKGDDAFQFTLPRGERRPAPDIVAWARGFNSRSRGGSDWQGIRRDW